MPDLMLGRLLQEMLQDCEGSVLTDSVFPVKLGVLLCFTAALVEDEFAGGWNSAAPHWVMDGFVQALVPSTAAASLSSHPPRLGVRGMVSSERALQCGDFPSPGLEIIPVGCSVVRE